MTDVFISYARSDTLIAEALARNLRRIGVSTSSDEQYIPFAKNLEQRMRKVLDSATLVIVIWSKAASKSSWVRREVELAFDAWETGRLLLVRVDDAEIPLGL